MIVVSTSIALAPPASKSTPFDLSATTIVIIVVVLIIGVLFILGWRSRDQSPHLDDKVEREKEE